MPPLPESQLYAPVRDHLIALGYTVRSEVQGCDICALRGEDLVVIELKARLSLDLLLQAVRRQRFCESVYVAVPAPAKVPYKRQRALQHLLRRLELGLIQVRGQLVEVIFHPLPYARKKQSKERRAVLQEVRGRSMDLNAGGSTRQPLVTAYREEALRVACLLDLLGPLSPARLRKAGAGNRTQAILYDNVYGWFERIDRGLYALSGKGRDGLTTYATLCEQLREQLRAMDTAK